MSDALSTNNEKVVYRERKVKVYVASGPLTAANMRANAVDTNRKAIEKDIRRAAGSGSSTAYFGVRFAPADFEYLKERGFKIVLEPSTYFDNTECVRVSWENV